ncbi:metallophosphoesterase [Acidipila sp. EB88]|uniref:metallophosphoesterase n=1 Tax=Acidipila sp. EB88 TaxID=2305226 RepID=UPI000F5E04A8|nr:metallophosphoesterase [Acidipila sp. EB88]RRA48058.1 metallophosphoesterase [Acidipila sp. EB88]
MTRIDPTLPGALSRRRFLQQSFAWSAFAALPALPARAFPAAPNALAAHALIVGDWGWAAEESPDAAIRAGGGYAAQSQVARGMRRFVQQHSLRPDALWMLGDSWYGDLEGGDASPRWLSQFEQMYPADAFPGPAYSMLGNHDYQRLPSTVNKVEAELAYARTGRGADGKPTRWTLPARWYTFDFPAHNPLIHCIVLDSNMPRPDGSWDHGANFTLKPEEQAEQLRWLEEQLRKPRTTPYLAVLAHHPVYSNGPHGDHPVLVREWDPLFRKYKVDLYMAGHDHDLQHLEFEGNPTTHFLSGAGGADLYVLKVDGLERGPYAQEVHGFSHLAVTARSLELRHLDADGRFLYGVSRTPAGKVSALSS